MYKGVVITHPEYGIFVGHAMGLCFWSQLDAVDQDCAATFESVEQAKEFTLEFGEDRGVADYDFHEVETEDEFGATVDELRNAGLGDLLGGLNKARVLN